MYCVKKTRLKKQALKGLTYKHTCHPPNGISLATLRLVYKLL